MSLDGVNGFLDVESAALRAPQVGVANTNPQHILSVGSNLYVSGDSSDVLTVDGNVVCEGVKVGLIEITPSYDLEAVANVGNSTSNTILFTNPDTGIVATGNVSVGKTLTVDGIRITAAAEADVDLDAVVAAGPSTARSIQLIGPADSISPETGTLTIGTNTGNFGGLGVAGNVHVGRGLYVRSNLEVGTANLFVNTVNSRVGIGKTNPDATLDVDGDAIIRGDLSVLGTTTTIDTNNLRVQDPIIELGKDNAGTGDLGLVMTRPTGSSNVAIIFDENADTLEIGYTDNDASATDITMVSTPLSVNVNGDLSVTSNLEVGTANLFVDTVNSRVGVGTTSPTATLDIYKEDTTAAGETVLSSITGVFSGSDPTGGNINNRGLYINLDSSATGGTATNTEEHRVWGIDVDIDVTGDSDDIRGGRFLVRSELAANGSDQNTNIWGIDAQGQHNGSAPNTNIIGVNARSFKGSDSTGLTTNMIGVAAEYELNTGTCTDAYGVRARFDRNGGAVTNSYLFYGDHLGSTTTITNNYGLYVTGADKHYLEGNVGIGTTNPSKTLDIGFADYGYPGIRFTHTDPNGIDRVSSGYEGFFTGIEAVIERYADKNVRYTGSNVPEVTHRINLGYSDSYLDSNGFYPQFHEMHFEVMNKVNQGDSTATLDRIMTLRGNGNVGIGTTSPGSKLQVYDDTNTKSLLSVREGPGGAARTEINSGIRFDTYSVENFGAGGSGDADRNYHIRFNDGRQMVLYYDGNDLQFWWGGGSNYVARASVGHSSTYGFTFTGQHRNFIKDISYKEVIEKELGGLIVCANNNEYVKISDGIAKGSNAITQNEALPIVSLSSNVCDKSCFGVISESEDPNSNRGGSLGMFKSYYDTEDGDKRIIINSLGEGAIWVTDINGTLESGDYITTSNVAGYGQKQDSEFLANYTVAKITMDCDFDPVTQPVQIIRKELSNVNYWVKTTYETVSEEEYSNLTEENRRTITETVFANEDGEIFPEQNEQSTYSELEQTIYQKITNEESKTEREGWELEVRQELVNVLDEHGQIQWEDDPSGATEKAYKIRYLDADGNITDEANAVYKAAFVGCTYHCG